MSVQLTDQQVFERLCQMGQESKEVMEFAAKRDKLQLFQAAEVEHEVLWRAARIVKAHLDEEQRPTLPTAKP